MTAPQVPRPRRHLTQAEFAAELKRAADDRTNPDHPVVLRASEAQIRALRTPTGRSRRWWMRGWKR